MIEFQTFGDEFLEQVRELLRANETRVSAKKPKAMRKSCSQKQDSKDPPL